jgi:hypothetical protein
VLAQNPNVSASTVFQAVALAGYGKKDGLPATRITDITPADEPVVKHKYPSKEERRRIVEETLAPGASVAVIARTHGVNANQVFQWRKLYHEGRLGPATASTQVEGRLGSTEG